MTELGEVTGETRRVTPVGVERILLQSVPEEVGRPGPPTPVGTTGITIPVVVATTILAPRVVANVTDTGSGFFDHSRLIVPGT